MAQAACASLLLLLISFLRAVCVQDGCMANWQERVRGKWGKGGGGGSAGGSLLA